jgi:hypothetical protein
MDWNGLAIIAMFWLQHKGTKCFGKPVTHKGIKQASFGWNGTFATHD